MTLDAAAFRSHRGSNSPFWGQELHLCDTEMKYKGPTLKRGVDSSRPSDWAELERTLPVWVLIHNMADSAAALQLFSPHSLPQATVTHQVSLNVPGP